VRWLTFPEKARKQVSKARELRRSGDYEGAVKRLKNVLKVHPAFAIAQNELGLSYWRMNMLEQARKFLEAAIRNDPEYLIPYLNLAEVWMREKEYNRAGQVLAQASKAQPDRGEPYYAMAKIQYDTGHLDRAEQACRLALERDTSKIPEVHILLANVYLRRGEKAKLAAELGSYLEKTPKGEHAETARTTLEKIQHEQVQTPPVPPKP
jgi:tetratricopeptide (TPR) repeat protein